MTNLLVSYASIPYEAIETATSVPFDEDWNSRNLISCDRYAYAKCTAGASGIVTVEYDLGSGITKGADHVIAARADYLKAQGATLLKLSTNPTGVGGSYTDVWSEASFSSATLYGSNNQDYIATGLSLAAARCWRPTISGGSATERSFSKLYFGTSWDPGVNPDAFDFVPADKRGSFRTGSGAMYLYKLANAKYGIQIEWRGVSTAKYQEFFKYIGRHWERHKFFVYTTAQHQILDFKRVLHVKIVEPPTHEMVQEKTGYHVIGCKFEEVTG